MRNNCWNFYNALSHETVDQIVQILQDEPLHRGVVKENGQSIAFTEDNEVRKSNVAFLDKQKHNSIFNLLYQYAVESNKMAYGFDIKSVEDVQFTVYDGTENGFYDWHIDTWWGNPTMSDRKISMTVQLSNREDYKGGDFEIKGIDFSPEDKIRVKNKGAIITFPSFLEHRVTPVTEGKRMSLVAWVQGDKFK